VKLHELITTHKWPEIKDRLFELYPEQKRNAKKHKRLLKNLKVMQPRNSLLTIILQHITNSDGEEYDSVLGMAGEIFNISTVDWDEWLGMDIMPYLAYTEIDILCHCLWEMTWWGFTEKKRDKQLIKLEAS